MPAMHDSPMRLVQAEIAKAGPWAAHLKDVRKARPILTAEQYWDLLRPRVASLDIWETTYIHALGGARGGGPDPIADWAAGSSLRPFLDRLPPTERAGFFRAYADAMRVAYPLRPDGTTLLPFRRLFFIATLP
jgi:trans-aconitate 2-methyltransferase